jgi:hypothetical protein
VEDLDREVVTLLPHQLPGLLLQHETSTVVGVDDLVSLFEVTDVRDLNVRFEARLHGLLY